MPYTKVHEDWEDLPSTDTPVTAAALEQIEEGIADATTAAESAASTASAASSAVTAHVADTSDAHDATAVSTTGSYANVQAYLEGLEADLPVGGFYSPGGDDVAVADGGTGASTAANARTNLGVPADTDVVHDTGDETIAGVKTFSSDPIIPDEVYGAGWNGVLEPATKNALYDKIETLQPLDTDLTALAGLSGVQGDVIYRDATQWQRLAKGTAGQVLTMNAGATAPEWADPTGESVTVSTQSVASTGLTTASTSYASNDVLGDGWSFTNMGTSGYIVGARLLDKADVVSGVDLILHSASVTFGTDNAAPSRSDTDAEKECGQLSVIALDEGAQRVAISGPTMTPYHTDAGTLYVAGVTRAAHTFFGAVGDLVLRLYYVVSA